MCIYTAQEICYAKTPDAIFNDNFAIVVLEMPLAA